MADASPRRRTATGRRAPPTASGWIPSSWAPTPRAVSSRHASRSTRKRRPSGRPRVDRAASATALTAARGFGLAWACLDAGNLAELPVLAGIDALTVAADHDQSVTRAVAAGGARGARA